MAEAGADPRPSTATLAEKQSGANWAAKWNNDSPIAPINRGMAEAGADPRPSTATLGGQVEQRQSNRADKPRFSGGCKDAV